MGPGVFGEGDCSAPTSVASGRWSLDVSDVSDVCDVNAVTNWIIFDDHDHGHLFCDVCDVCYVSSVYAMKNLILTSTITAACQVFIPSCLALYLAFRPVTRLKLQ